MKFLILGLILWFSPGLEQPLSAASDAIADLSRELGKTLTHSADSVKFRYQENFSPWKLLECSHKRGDSPVDWHVKCGPAGQKQFRVHLKVSYYRNTVYGKSGYELLYWLTQTKGAKEAGKHNSLTVWIHNEQEVQASVIEAAAGVENDQSVLRLFLKL